MSFFRIPRSIIRKVVSECITCTQPQPLKTKEKQVHVLAKRPLERLMIDLVDSRQYKNYNEGYSWLLTIIDVFLKYGCVFPSYTKTGKRWQIILKTYS